MILNSAVLQHMKKRIAEKHKFFLISLNESEKAINQKEFEFRIVFNLCSRGKGTLTKRHTL